MKNVKHLNKYIELHAHLDGSITVSIAKELSIKQDIPLPSNDDAELIKLFSVKEDNRSLEEYLTHFELPLSFLQTYEGLSKGMELVANNMHSQGVIYAEIRFAPQLHQRKNMSQEQAVKAALDGLKNSKLKDNLNIILSFMRGKGNENDNLETLRLAKKYLVKHGGVVAVDLAGAEASFPTSEYRELFNKVKDKGVPFTIHAGEADGPQSVMDAIDFGAKRIGHGVKIYEDENVMNIVKEKGITLEMCPTSNKHTQAITDMSKYPLIDFLKKGLKVTVNTDDMAISRITLKSEFEYLEQNFGLTYEQEIQIIKNSIDAAFTTPEVKERLKKEFGLYP